LKVFLPDSPGPSFFYIEFTTPLMPIRQPEDTR
jgi:hypothetical protein